MKTSEELDERTLEGEVVVAEAEAERDDPHMGGGVAHSLDSRTMRAAAAAAAAVGTCLTHAIAAALRLTCVGSYAHWQAAGAVHKVVGTEVVG